MKRYPALIALLLCSFSVPADSTDFEPVRSFPPNGSLVFELDEFTRHPFYWWPDTLLSYPVRFTNAKVRPDQLAMKGAKGEAIPFQLSEVRLSNGLLEYATVSFFSDLPSGGRRSFTLSSTAGPASSAGRQPHVRETRDGNAIVVDGGAVKVRIPASQTPPEVVPGPILQLSRGGKWMGSSRIVSPKRAVTRIETTRLESGPLFIEYRITYSFANGASYDARVRVVSGYDFVQFREEVKGIQRSEGIFFESDWSDLQPTHRHAPNHPYTRPNPRGSGWSRYEWERIDDVYYNTHLGVSGQANPEGRLPFRLGAYQPTLAFVTLNSACFWNERTNDTIGVFIDRHEDWQDNEYAIWSSANTIQVGYYYRDGKFSWRWPLVTGTRSTGVAVYDHQKDRAAMERLEKIAAAPVKHSDGLSYRAQMYPETHTSFLQNRYGTVHLDTVKDWVLSYPDNGRIHPPVFPEGRIRSAAELESTVMAGAMANGMVTCGTRSIYCFGPVSTRAMYSSYTDGLNRLWPQLTAGQKKRLTAWYLMLAYVSAGEEFMPMETMLSGHPNFLADVKSVPALAAFLFPDHPMAGEWADQLQKFFELNTRYHTRPEVKSWEASGGRWTENLGTYVWAFLRPAVRAEFALRRFNDGANRIAIPQIAQISDWALNALSAPFDGEDPEWYRRWVTGNHAWGIVSREKGPRRLHPPQGAHSARRMPPRILWWLGDSLKNYNPLLAEHLMWAARPVDDDSEHPAGGIDSWKIMYPDGDNFGTNPHLKSSKYTGYGIVMRAAVGTPGELSIHLQQLDPGPNYRWGIAGEGGNGVIYFYAGGKSYSYNGREDVGDRRANDTDFCSNFGAWKEGGFRSIGRDVLSGPLYDLGSAQYAEIYSRKGRDAYSYPEYRGRSIMLVGSDYFVTYDDVFNDAVSHRFSWFTHPSDDMPNIQMVKGGRTGRREQLVELKTDEVRGIWRDGQGDAMAVISHKSGFDASEQPYGALVKRPDGVDYIFRNPDGIEILRNGIGFRGTAGLVRQNSDGSHEMAIFEGNLVQAGGARLTVEGSLVGVSARFRQPEEMQGVAFARNGGRMRIECRGCSESAFYLNGVRRQAVVKSDSVVVALPAGRHQWQLTRRLPVPLPPAVERTEYGKGTAVVYWAEAGGADRYFLEISEDNARTWRAAGSGSDPRFALKGLRPGRKYHVRVAAANAEHRSEPGPEYPVYSTDSTPAHPDGLRLKLEDGRLEATWGEVLGTREYRLYRRQKGDPQFRLVYQGRERRFTDKASGVVKPFARPGIMANRLRDTSGYTVYEYAVAAVNGNGESPKSPVADTNPASWANWDPRPGEGFRRHFNYNTQNYEDIGEVQEYERYYPE